MLEDLLRIFHNRAVREYRPTMGPGTPKRRESRTCREIKDLSAYYFLAAYGWNLVGIPFACSGPCQYGITERRAWLMRLCTSIFGEYEVSSVTRSCRHFTCPLQQSTVASIIFNKDRAVDETITAGRLRVGYS